MKIRSNQRGASNVYLCGEYMRALSTSAGGIVYTCSVHKKSRHHNVVELFRNGILFLLNDVSLWVCNFMSHVYLYNCLDYCLWLMFFPIKWFANMHTGVNLNQCNVVLEKPSTELGLSPQLSLLLSLDRYPNPILGLNQLLIPSVVLTIPLQCYHIYLLLRNATIF